MSDVAMHLFHSVEVAALEDGGEEALIEFYHSRLRELLGDRGDDFTIEVASRLYDMCLLDYGDSPDLSLPLCYRPARRPRRKIPALTLFPVSASSHRPLHVLEGHDTREVHRESGPTK